MVKHATPLLSILICSVLAACSPREQPAPASADPAPLAEATGYQPFDLGPHHRKVSTRSDAAQAAFDQGLIWTYSFNYDEAIRAYEEAARLDPSLAMAHWGIALANGPHINNPYVDEAHAKAAWDAMTRARERAAGASEVERALIEALGARYAWPQPEDRSALDAAYAQAMAEVHKRFPQDADVTTLYAESLLDLHPWDQWTPDGTAKEGTREILDLLAHAQELDPKHPGALHLWIHSFEASQEPERAEQAADVLRTLVPDAGHMLHMPGHIDMRLGRWAQGAAISEKAIAADERYVARQKDLGFYSFYMLHNQHFLAFTAMMEGRSAVAIEITNEIVRGLSPDKVRAEPLFLDAFQTVALDTLKRFGRWPEILATPAPGDEFPVGTAFWHFSRGIALGATGRLAEAEAERAELQASIPRIPDGAFWGSNLARDVMQPALPYLDGEIAYRRGKLDEAVARLSEAVALEDALKFDDPPPWTTPSRHALGAVLLEAGKPAEAEAVYRADLRRFPENGWALRGLAQSLSAQGKAAEAAPVAARFEAQWARADIALESSCLCVKPGGGR